MKIDCVIPTRGDRKEFVDFAVKQMENQTMHPSAIDVIDYPPQNERPDLSRRYLQGIKRRLSANADLIFFIEDDDFYCPEYIETMVTMWTAAGKPALFGLNTTTYYHLDLCMYGIQSHEGRASMYSTMITKDFDLSRWPRPHEVFVDLKIWKSTKNKKAVTPLKTICLGIKHGTGKCGGSMHNAHMFAKSFKRKGIKDHGLDYLQQVTGPGFWFYKAIINRRVSQR